MSDYKKVSEEYPWAGFNALPVGSNPQSAQQSINILEHAEIIRQVCRANNVPSDLTLSDQNYELKIIQQLKQQAGRKIVRKNI